MILYYNTDPVLKRIHDKVKVRKNKRKVKANIFN